MERESPWEVSSPAVTQGIMDQLFTQEIRGKELGLGSMSAGSES